MSVAYSVTIGLGPIKDPEGLKKKLIIWLNTDELGVVLKDQIPDVTIENFFTHLVGGRNQMEGDNTLGENVYYNAFDGTYTWAVILENAFKAAAPYLTDDAYMVVNNFHSIANYIINDGVAYVQL